MRRLLNEAISEDLRADLTSAMPSSELAMSENDFLRISKLTDILFNALAQGLHVTSHIESFRLSVHT